jgi:hypothetical protein
MDKLPQRGKMRKPRVKTLGNGDPKDPTLKGCDGFLSWLYLRL